MASLNLRSVARCFRTATYRLTVSPAFRPQLSNSYLAATADFWGFNCFWRCSTIVSYVRESSLNNIGATKSFASWYISVGRLVNRTASSVSSQSLHWPRRRILAVMHTLRSRFPLRTSELFRCSEPDFVPHQPWLAS